MRYEKEKTALSQKDIADFSKIKILVSDMRLRYSLISCI